MAELREGSTLKGRYVLRRRLGHGGMAAVWLGEDLVLDRSVAVKVLFDAVGSDREYAARFRREATVAAGLSHPNLVRIYDYSESDERPFLVMEFVPGEDLGRRIDRGVPIDRDELARELLGAVAHIHGHGIVHRDIKPHNVIVSEDGSAKLIDFGIALPPDATALTQPGLVIATKRYAAPEVLAGDSADARSDLYSCGVLLDACAGPASSDLRRLISRLTNQEPEDRPASAVAALTELEAGPPTQPQQATEPFVPTFAESPVREQPPASKREPVPPPAGVYRNGRSNRNRWFAALAILAVAVAVGIAVASSGGGGSPERAEGGSSRQGHRRAKHAAASKRGAQASGKQPQAPEQIEEEGPSEIEEEGPPEVVGATSGAGDPATGIALNEEGFALIQAGEYEAAVPVLEESVASFPAGSEQLDYAYALFNLGDALRRSGRPADAIPVLEQRLQIPDQTEVVERELAAAKQEAEAAGD
jgi:serine/threonine-protein kinase